MSSPPYNVGLDKNPANFVALSPISFLERAAQVHPGRPAIIYGDHSQSWAVTYRRCRQLAGALRTCGVGAGDTVSVMLPNVPAMFEAHYGVPMCGAVLNTLNTRLDAESISFMLAHSQAAVFIVDVEFASVAKKALELLPGDGLPTLVWVEDAAVENAPPLEGLRYERLLELGSPDFEWQLPSDEWDAIALNYTSGTTGAPKGVVTHHRGAYLNSVNNVIAWNLPQNPVYLWTLPMFHCNGWCFPWSMALVAGTSICIRRVEPNHAWELIRKHQVTHMCGAPIVYTMLLAAAANSPAPAHTMQGLIAGAAPPSSVIEGCEAHGIALTHVYGLTEVYGPASVCVKQDAWNELSSEQRARLNGRQGVAYPLQQAVSVLNPTTMVPVTADGETVGEVMFRGNVVMKGYLKNPTATAEAFANGWFHTGDLGVIEPDGYIKIKDRSKDIIISGGENISSLEVEDVLHRHPAILCAAVVALPDEKWGEVPCAFVELRPGQLLEDAEVFKFCSSHLARFKVPKRVIFGELPKTSTGKIQKFELRNRCKSASAIG